MAVIRFSHVYPKLHGQKRATLVAVRPIRIDENTPKELLEYDTAYDGGHFPLPYGDYKQLVFVGDKGIPFCTIREHYPAEKGDYYDGSLGDVFEIKIKSEKEVAEQNPVKRDIQSNNNMAKLRKALERAKEKAIYIVRNYRKPHSLTGNILELLAYQNEAIEALDALATSNKNACKTKILSLDEAIEHAQSCIGQRPNPEGIGFPRAIFMNEQETSADIISEMLEARTEFPFVYLMGEPDTPEEIDDTTKEIIDPRKINIRRVTVKELACRLDAARKRESGNAAALREALVKIYHEIRSYCHDYGAGESHESLVERILDDPPDYTIYKESILEIDRVVETALAEPPRNCDLPLIVDGPADNNADKAWIVFKHRNPDAYFDVYGLLRCIDWLLAPATEQKGENNENK